MPVIILVVWWRNIEIRKENCVMSVCMSIFKPNGKNFKDFEDAYHWEWQDLNLNHIIDYTHSKRMAGYSWHRVEKRFSDFSWLSLSDNPDKSLCKYLPCDVCAYAQGWFFKKSFFKKKFTYCICTTKNQMQGILKKYLDFKDECAYDIYRHFMSVWEDGMIFELSF